jgi:hypothetical protein
VGGMTDRTACAAQYADTLQKGPRFVLFLVRVGVMLTREK